MASGPTDMPEVPEFEFIEDSITSRDLPSLEFNFPELRSIQEPRGRIEVERVQPVIRQLYEKHRALNFEEAYDVRSEPKGLCCIINNKIFKVNKLDERTGTDNDRDNLKNLFEKLGYRVEVHDNLKAKKMLATCEEFILRPEQAKFDSCVLAILTHGHLGFFVGTDGKKLPETDVFNLFNHPQCRLFGKPKLVIVQACRVQLKSKNVFQRLFGGNAADVLPGGTGEDEQIGDMIERLAHLNYEDEQQVEKSLTPDNADLLIAHSTLPGYLSWRNRSQGSWFVQAIVEIFSRRCGEEHVADMLVMVNQVVSRAFGQNRCSQLPCPTNHLRKKFYFFPTAD